MQPWPQYYPTLNGMLAQPQDIVSLSVVPVDSFQRFFQRQLLFVLHAAFHGLVVRHKIS